MRTVFRATTTKTSMEHAGSQRARTAMLLVALAPACGSLSGALHFRRGDVVPVMKRSQYMGERSPWREVPYDASPQFERSSVVTLHALPPDFATDNEAPEEFKMSFSFLNDQFITSWITLADGKGAFLTHLLFTIEHAGDQVTHVSWQTWYDESDAPPEHVSLEYRFVDAAQQDPRSALTALFATSLLCSVIGLVAACGESELGEAILGPAHERAAARKRFNKGEA